MFKGHKPFAVGFIGFIILWILCALASVAGTGLILYILWRIACML